jgi:hypothetical protein
MKMTRQANPESKTQSVIVVAKNESDSATIKYFKEVCKRDGLELRKEILNLIEVSWKKMHPPPGNPQLQIVQFQTGKSMGLFGTCGFVGCHAKAVAKGVFLPSGQLYHLCAAHRIEALGNRRNWKINST